MTEPHQQRGSENGETRVGAVAQVTGENEEAGQKYQATDNKKLSAFTWSMY